MKNFLLLFVMILGAVSAKSQEGHLCFQGIPITFQKGNSVMVNATEMARPFRKRAVDWLNTQSAKDFVNALSEVRKITSADLVAVTKGGLQQGTWMHEDVALEFARWLSPAFAIWCNDRIKELFRTGIATVRNDDEAIAYAMEVLNKRLSESKQRVQILEGENSHLQEQNRILAPKAQYTDEVLQSTSTYTLTQIAHDLGLRSVHALTRVLMERKIIYRQSGQWQPTAKVADKGYFDTRTAKFVKSDNTIGTSMTTVITESGRQFLHSLIGKEVSL